MKLQALIAGLTMLVLIARAPSFALTNSHIDARADRALAHFYKLNPAIPNQDSDFPEHSAGVRVGRELLLLSRSR